MGECLEMLIKHISGETFTIHSTELLPNIKTFVVKLSQLCSKPQKPRNFRPSNLPPMWYVN